MTIQTGNVFQKDKDGVLRFFRRTKVEFTAPLNTGASVHTTQAALGLNR